MAKDLSVYGDITNYPCSLVMSGVESDTYFDIAVGEDIDRMLMSFLYIQRKGKSFLSNRLKKHPNIKMMIDSGAHTFHAKEEEYKNKPLSFWDDYLQRYVDFIRANRKYIFSCVELDIAHIVGFDKVDYFREKYFEPLRNEGILVCYVWHEYDGEKHWREMCEKYDYVGFSLTNSNLNERQITQMMNYARRCGALVHGFAVTRIDIMSKVPFFTGDSTTWLVGTQYGELNWFDGRKLKRVKKDKWKREYLNKFVSIGANAELMKQENPYELIRINLITFKQAETYIRKRIRGKSYWLNQKAEIKPTTTLRRKIVPKNTVEGEVKEVEEKPKLKIKRKKKILPKENKEFSIEPKEETVKNEVSAVNRDGSVEGNKSKFDVFKEFSGGSNELRDLDEQIALLPDSDWFNGDMLDYEDYIQALGLETNGNDKDYILDQLYNLTTFLKEPKISFSFEEDLVIEVAQNYTKDSSIDDYEMARSEIINFLSENLTLEVKSLFPKNHNVEMSAIERPKEREKYIEEDEYELVDVTEEEMKIYLPENTSEMPEVDELDKELATNNIVAIRDEKGRFVKGQKRVRKPKQIYSEKYPKLACNTCYKAGDCPEFEPDSVCAFDKMFKRFDVRKMDDVFDAMYGMANINLERMQRMAMFEIMDGGMADPTVTAMIDQNTNLLMKMQQLAEQKDRIIATQRRTLHADGRTEETTSISNPSSGILAQIFSSPASKEVAEVDTEDILDVEAEVIEDE